MRSAIVYYETTMHIVQVSIRSIVTAVVAVLVFGIIFVVGHYATWSSFPDARLTRYYIGMVAVLGIVPVVLGLYRLGLVFIAGASVGWIVDCVVSAAGDPLRPTMQAGMYNLFILVLGALAAIVMEVAHQKRRHGERNAESSGRTPA